MVNFLVVEDSNLQQKLLKQMLEKLGFSEVEFAGDYHSAIEAYKDQEVLLFDVMLPGKSGIDVFEHCKKKNPHLKGIAMTDLALNDFEKNLNKMDLAASSNHMHTHAKDSKPTFLTKPVTLPTLRQALKSASLF